MSDDLARQFMDSLYEEALAHSTVLYCMKMNERSKEWNTGYHSHDFLEILYFVKGEALIEGNNSHRALSTNDLIIYPPGFGHKEYMDFSRHQEVICLAIELRKSFKYDEVIALSDMDHKLEWIFLEFYKHFKKREFDIVNQLKYLLFSYIKQCGQSGYVSVQPLTIRVSEYLENHFKERISQKELCELVNVSPSYLNRVFKKKTGLTPIEFLNRRRIEEAAVLIKKDFLSIEMVASEVGIADPKYFSRVFKKVTGFSPSRFRQLNL